MSANKRSSAMVHAMRRPRPALLVIIAVSLHLFPGSVAAKDLPRYDVEAYCTTVSEFSGGSRMIFNGCIELEQEAYDELRATWAALPERTRSYCQEVARFGGNSYSMLQGCVDLETEAADETPVFRY